MREPTVASVMTRGVVTVELHTPFKEVVALLAEHGISAVPVLDGGRVAGVVSEVDLLANQEYRGGSAPVPSAHADRDRWRKATGTTASHVMTSPAIVIDPGAPLGEAMGLLGQSTVRRLFVVDGDGVLVGVLARRDLLRTYLRADGDILGDIRDLVLREELSLDPDRVAVEVDAGRVRLAGWLERRSQVERVVALVRLLAGVVDVRCEVGFDVDDETPR
ncbi:CBS domain-containing protein [Umezawaea endophytica]|uniref:CBS domain-containing protein n=1 Tax=Umezawaea endophytica TaxID=1654476 RepID=A0A9X2VM95_9PSEU|nr:CBS domain-containing protein [Umezawaea endophytica]MCS7479358.1 CBS domain-containing protein [Umezawaea endophytica]